MRPDNEILSWLSQIPGRQAPPQPQPINAGRKRPRSPKLSKPIDAPFLPSTPISLPLSDSSHRRRDMPDSHDAANATLLNTPPRPFKKLKTAERPTTEGEQAAEDQDVTPRPILPPPSASAPSESSDTTSSQRSGRSSPLKRLRSLALREDGIQTRPFQRSDRRLPPTLVELLDEMTDIGEGIQVIPAVCEAEIQREVAAAASAGRAPSFRPPRAMHYTTPQSMQVTSGGGGEAQAQAQAAYPRPELLVQQVLGIVEWAAICQKRNAEEAAWNSQVHYPILRLALHGGDRPALGALVDVTQCTSATIIREYLTSGASGKKVDFVLHIDPSAAMADGGTSEAAARIDERRSMLPLLSINHTDHEALLREPLVVSIETKKIAADRAAAEAQVQLGIWQAAQWSLLADLVTKPKSGSSSSDSDSGNALQQLPFLPGIIVQGHDWAFVATTREGKKTVLWSECPFGSTRDLLGVFKIICGIQKLAAFARETYWPWYQTHVLGLSGAQQIGS